MNTPRRWVIGRAPDCDLVVSQSEVSARHCRLTDNGTEFRLEDLGSANGTWVNGKRITAPVTITRADRVTLGKQVALPWPPDDIEATLRAMVLRIGRAPDNDIVLDYPMVSGHHARVVIDGAAARIEDLGSTNGTALARPQNKVKVAPIKPDDIVYLGSLRLPAAKLMVKGTAMGAEPHASIPIGKTAIVFGRAPDCDQVLNYPMVSAHHARLFRRGDEVVIEDLGSSNGTFVNQKRITSPTRVKQGDVIGLGSYTLTLMEGGELQKRDYRGNVTLEARYITVDVPRKRLLETVSLTLFPSEFVGLMGPSGAGKTTLMMALNGYTPPTEGHVSINGLDLYEHYDQFRTGLGYVPQEDVIHRELTVGQALYYSARLRLPPDYSKADIQDRIRQVISQLGLEGTENVLIGSAEKKGISGGQRKRVNLAMELLTDPLVLFLDEPTSGLSSEDALMVMKVLRQLADSGKTILLTIHQPSLEVFRAMDNLVLVAKDANSKDPGRLVYYGPAYPDAVQFFNPNPPPDWDPSPDEVLRGLGRGKCADWVKQYKTSRYCKEYVTERAGKNPAGEHRPIQQTRRASALLLQWRVLVQRCLSIRIKDVMNTLILLAQAPIVALLVVIVFGNQVSKNTDSFADWTQVTHSLGTTLFLMTLAAIWFGASNAVREIVGERAIYHRERMVNLSLLSYIASKFTVLGLLCVIQCLILLGIVSSGCDLRGPWWAMFGLLILAGMVGVAIGLTLSALAKTSEVAIALLPIVTLGMVILGGTLRPIHEMPKPVQYVCGAIPSRWAFEGMLLVEANARPLSREPSLPGQEEKPEQDMAEAFFPKEEHRSNVGFTILAQGIIFVALTIGIGVILRMRDVH